MAAAAALKVAPNVAMIKQAAAPAVMAVTQLTTRCFESTVSRTPKKLKANPPRMALMKANCRKNSAKVQVGI